MSLILTHGLVGLLHVSLHFLLLLFFFFFFVSSSSLSSFPSDASFFPLSHPCLVTSRRSRAKRTFSKVHILLSLVPVVPLVTMVANFVTSVRNGDRDREGEGDADRESERESKRKGASKRVTVERIKQVCPHNHRPQVEIEGLMQMLHTPSSTPLAILESEN